MADEKRELAESGAETHVEASREPPPVGGSWRNVYLFVLGALGVTIVLLALLTWTFR